MKKIRNHKFIGKPQYCEFFILEISSQIMILGSPKVSPLRENLLDNTRPFLFTTNKQKGLKVENHPPQSRNTENVGLSSNTSKLTENYSSITKVRKPSQNF